MESIGEQFKQAREARGDTLSQAASATRIKIQHLESMERDDFSNMAAAAYARGFIKIYAEYLEIPVEPLVQAYSTQHAPGSPRQGISSGNIPEAPRPDGTETPVESQGASGSESALDTGRIQRIVLAVAAIVVGVLLVAGIAKLIGRGNPDAGNSRPGAGSEAPVLIVADPPDTYLDLPAEESQP